MGELLTVSNCWNERKKPPVIQVTKLGKIRFSVEAAKLYNLTEKDRISFYIPDDNDIIYFWKDNQSGFALSEIVRTDSGNRYSICCRPLAAKILSHFRGNGNISISAENKTVGGKWILSKKKIKNNKK